MKRSDGLKDVLEDFTRIFSENDRKLTVKYDSQPHADKHGNYVAVSPNVRKTYGKNVSTTQELRLILDTLAHEVEHVNRSDLSAKQEFAERHPECPELAGYCLNAVEDERIDFTRTQRFPGMAKSRAFAADLLMENHHRRPRVDSMDDRTGALIETMIQVSISRRAKGIENDSELREWSGVVSVHLDRARHAETQEERMNIAESLLESLKRYLPDGTTGREADDAMSERDLPPTSEDGEIPDVDPSDADITSDEPLTNDGAPAGGDDSSEEAADDGSEGGSEGGDGGDGSGDGESDEPPADEPLTDDRRGGGESSGVVCPECGGGNVEIGGESA